MCIEDVWKSHPGVVFPVSDDSATLENRARTAWFYSTKGSIAPWDVPAIRGDFLVFGPETRGLSDEILESAGRNIVSFPQVDGTRSLNVSNAVAAAVYLIEARWQNLARNSVL